MLLQYSGSRIKGSYPEVRTILFLEGGGGNPCGQILQTDSTQYKKSAILHSILLTQLSYNIGSS